MTGAMLQAPDRGLNRAVDRCLDGRKTHSAMLGATLQSYPENFSQTRLGLLYELYNALYSHG